MFSFLLLGCATPDASIEGQATAKLDTAAAPLHIGVPAYFYPGRTWTTLTASAGPVGIAIVNPASGPGTTVDVAYTRTISRARAAGIELIGYVSTAYGARAQADVEADIDAWYTLYGVDGIFLDEVPGTDTCAAEEGLYQTYADDIRAHDALALVALNPGTDTCATYLDFADILMTFEDSGAAYGGYVAPAWTAAYPPDRFWHLIYNVGPAQMPAVLDAARANNAGWVYVTSDRLPNPWDTLPRYWTAETALVTP